MSRRVYTIFLFSYYPVLRNIVPIGIVTGGGGPGRGGDTIIIIIIRIISNRVSFFFFSNVERSNVILFIPKAFTINFNGKSHYYRTLFRTRISLATKITHARSNRTVRWPRERTGATKRIVRFEQSCTVIYI